MLCNCRFIRKSKKKLPIAVHKSDISSAEDNSYNDVNRNKLKRLGSLSPNMNNVKKVKFNNLKSNSSINSCPPSHMSKGIKIIIN